MNRLLFLVPVIALLGCDMADRTTPAAKRTTTETVVPSPVSTVPPARVTEPAGGGKTDPADPPGKTDPKDPPTRPPEQEERKEEPPEEAPPIPAAYKALNKGKTLFFEKAEDGTRRVHVLAEVCLREGLLEMFLCKLNTKEHESILHADVDGRELHFALVAAGGEPGSPVRFTPQFQAATGTKIKVSVTYREKGKVKTALAGEWIKDKKTGKDMAHDWVFAGSKFFQDPERPNAPQFYTANGSGEYISLSNFPDSIMDLPVKSPKDVADLIFEIQTARIPPLRTPVIVTLEPVLEKKK